MSRQRRLSVAEWHRVATLLYEAQDKVHEALRLLEPRSRLTDRACKALRALWNQIGTVRRGSCEERFFVEHPTEQCGCFCGAKSCRHEQSHALPCPDEAIN